MPARAGEAFDRRLIAPLILGSILNPINSSIIAVSLVPIGQAFAAPVSQTTWLISALYLATAVGQPVVGRFVDSFGPRPLFLTGATLTGVAGLLGTLAPSLGVLIGARVLLGLGTCAGYPAAMFLIRSEADRTGQESPGSVLTALAVANQTVAVIGPTLGGLLIGIGGWRMTLLINVPLSVACLSLGLLRLPRISPAARTGGARRPEVDSLGIALFAATLIALLLFLMEIETSKVWLLGISAVALVAFTVRELRTRVPFVDLRLLAGNAPLVCTYGRNLLAQTVTYAYIYGFTQWTEDSRGFSASEAGLALIPLSIVAIAVSATTGRRREIRGKLIVGAIGQIVACALMLNLDPSTPVWVLIGLAMIVGVPQGLNSLANQNAVYYQAQPDRIGASAGLLRTFGYLGAIIASAATGGFFGARASTSGLHELSLFLIVVAGLFLALTVLDRSLSRSADSAFIPHRPRQA